MTFPAGNPTVITRAFTFAIDPTPEQATQLRSHVGGSRFAYNDLLDLISANWNENREKKAIGLEVTKNDYLSTSHFSLLNLWVELRNEIAPWWAENGSSAYNDAAQRLSRAIANFHEGRAEFPADRSS